VGQSSVNRFTFSNKPAPQVDVPGSIVYATRFHNKRAVRFGSTAASGQAFQHAARQVMADQRPICLSKPAVQGNEIWTVGRMREIGPMPTVVTGGFAASGGRSLEL
jgi:hypothetical protein